MCNAVIFPLTSPHHADDKRLPQARQGARCDSILDLYGGWWSTSRCHNSTRLCLPTDLQVSQLALPQKCHTGTWHMCAAECPTAMACCGMQASLPWQLCCVMEHAWGEPQRCVLPLRQCRGHLQPAGLCDGVCLCRHAHTEQCGAMMPYTCTAEPMGQAPGQATTAV